MIGNFLLVLDIFTCIFSNKSFLLSASFVTQYHIHNIYGITGKMYQFLNTKHVLVTNCIKRLMIRKERPKQFIFTCQFNKHWTSVQLHFRKQVGGFEAYCIKTHPFTITHPVDVSMQNICFYQEQDTLNSEICTVIFPVWFFSPQKMSPSNVLTNINFIS